MSMSKSHGGSKRMSAEQADKFEEDLEGEDFGSLDDWETDLAMKIIKIEGKLKTGTVEADNTPVYNMLSKKLVTYNTALAFLDANPKAAAVIGGQGGLQSIIAYITKQAVEDAAKDEVRNYSDRIKPKP
jgi:hypothetical protein